MRPELALPVDAVGRLVLRSPDGVVLGVQARRKTLELEVDSLRDLWRLRRSLPASGGRARLARDVARLSATTGLDCVVRLRDRTVARVDGGGRSGWLSRTLGLGPVRIHPFALIAGALPARRPS